jgi:exodeoxyribonuclease III
MTSVKFQSWNINGIRAALKKGLIEKVNELNPDILGLQEIKCDDEMMKSLFPGNIFSEGYKIFWHSCTMKKGYSGTALIIKEEVMENVSTADIMTTFGNEEFDIEGRLIGIKLQIGNEKICFLNGYYPQGGRDGRVEYKINFYDYVYQNIKAIKLNGYHPILTGDFNTTVADIDLARPKENRKTTGCLPEERTALKLFTDELNCIDIFRSLYPEKDSCYTYWDQITRARDRNVGWRIDMMLMDSSLENHVIDAKIYPEMLGSDHCPIELELKL